MLFISACIYCTAKIPFIKVKWPEFIQRARSMHHYEINTSYTPIFSFLHIGIKMRITAENQVPTMKPWFKAEVTIILRKLSGQIIRTRCKITKLSCSKAWRLNSCFLRKWVNTQNTQKLPTTTPLTVALLVVAMKELIRRVIKCIATIKIHS